MALLDTLVGELVGPKSVSTLSKTSGADAGQIQNVIASALPVLLSSMHQNATTPEGAASLSSALDRHAEKASHSTSSMLESVDKEDGKKIVKHVLGGDTDKVTKQLAKNSGLDTTQVTSILSTLAPVVLSLLGSHKQENKKESASTDLTSMLADALLGGSGKNNLDLGSLASTLLGGGASSGGLLGSLLGGGSNSGSQSASSGIDIGGIASALLGGSSGHSKKDNTSNALSSLLSGLLK